jgi:hypothetical protein
MWAGLGASRGKEAGDAPLQHAGSSTRPVSSFPPHISVLCWRSLITVLLSVGRCNESNSVRMSYLRSSRSGVSADGIRRPWSLIHAQHLC